MIEKAVRQIYSLLCNCQYEEIVKITAGITLSSNQIAKSIAEYKCQLIPYPDNLVLDVIKVKDSNPQEWSVIAPIFTKEEGLSDLSIELSLVEKEVNLYKVELENIRVR